MPVPLVNLKAQHESLQEEIREAFGRVLSSGQFILGPEVEAFEKAFADYCGVREAVGLNNGTMALYLALLALGIGSGDEVITVAQTFMATAEAIVLAGARPVFVDIDEKTFTMDPAELKRAMNPKTKAVIPVHLYGHPAAMDPILEVAKSRRVPVIEDAAQAHGAKYRGRRVGGLGEIGCFSFYPSKNLGALGEAGAVVTNNPSLADRIRKLRNHGSVKKEQPPDLIGTNGRMEALQAAALNVKLRYLDRWNKRRRELAGLYRELLRGSSYGLPPEGSSETESVFHLYVIRSSQRDKLQSYLNGQGIWSQVHYPLPIHLLAPFKIYGYRESSLPRTEAACREVISIPLYPEMNEEELRTVVRALRDFDSC